MTMETAAIPVFGACDPFSLENLDMTSSAAPSPDTGERIEERQEPVSASPLSAVSVDSNSTNKRQRLPSDDYDRLPKRHMPSSPCPRTQTVNFNTPMTTSAPAAQRPAPTRGRDSGFYSDAQDVEPKPGHVSTPSAPYDDSGFQDGLSDAGTHEVNTKSQTSPCHNEALDQTRPVGLPSDDETASSGTSVAMSAANAVDKVTFSADATQATSSEHRECSFVQDRGSTEADSAIVVCLQRDEETAIYVQNQDEASLEDDTEYTVSHITSHRVDPTDGSIELLVHWENPDVNEATWEPEENLQENALDAVTSYWETVEGGRLAVRPYEVLAIRGHEWLRKGKAKARTLHFEVEWLGYKQRTMEPWRRFTKDQPKLVEEYFQLIGGRPQLS